MTNRFPKRKFPKLRPDGSFCVEVTLNARTTDLDALASRITEWIESFLRNNRYWTWPFAKEKGGVVDFFDEFVATPSCVATPPHSLVIRVEAKPEAKWWKDWLVVRLLGDLRKDFDNEIVGVNEIGDCS